MKGKLLRKKRLLLSLLGIFFACLLIVTIGIWRNPSVISSLQNRFIPKNIYVEFSSDIYDIITANYWERVDEEKFTNLYKLAADKITGSPQTLPKPTKDGVLQMIQGTIRSKKSEEKKAFVTTLADAVLSNLQPFGRSRLYTQKLETQLRETVANIDRSVNLYDSLGVDKSASESTIAQAFTEKKEQLEKEASTEARQKLAEVNRAYQALSEEDKRKRYDTAGIEPTFLVSFPKPTVAYVNLKKFSPTTMDELTKIFTSEVDPTKHWIILDMRGNVGGAIDGLQFLLGPFIGSNVAAYEFFHQGEYQQFRTKAPRIGDLGVTRKLIVLIDGATQSSAELMAAALKKFNVAIVIGTHSKGWGTVENVFPIATQIDENETYSVFLVHSVTIRDDGMPIEGRGVDPHIDVTEPDWIKKLDGIGLPYDVQEVITSIYKQ